MFVLLSCSKEEVVTEKYSPSIEYIGWNLGVDSTQLSIIMRASCNGCSDLVVPNQQVNYNLYYESTSIRSGSYTTSYRCMVDCALTSTLYFSGDRVYKPGIYRFVYSMDLDPTECSDEIYLKINRKFEI